MIFTKRTMLMFRHAVGRLALCALGLFDIACVTSSDTVLKSKEKSGIDDTQATSGTPPSSDDNGANSDAADTSPADAGPAPGGRSPLGMIPSAVADWSSAYPFVDLMKQSREWTDWDFGDNDFDLDDNGWVCSLGPGQTAGTVFLTNAGMPIAYDRVVVRYDGVGTIAYDWDAEKIDAASTPGRDVVRIGAGDHLLKITETDPDDYLRNIAIVPEPLEGNYDAGQIFNPVWLDHMQGLGAVRFSKWSRINESRLEHWADRPLGTDRTWATRGVPYEVMFALANRLKTSPWLTIPHLATDDFVRKLATLVEDALDADLTVYVEHTNAPWDPKTDQYRYAVEAGEARWGPEEDAALQWHGMRTATLCDIFKTEVFADAPKRVHCVMTVPVDSPSLTEMILTCPYWTEEGDGRAPCYRHGIDSIAVSGFFHGCLQDAPFLDEIRTWLDDDDGGMAKGMEQLADGRHLAGCDHDIAAIGAHYAEMAGLAERFGLALNAYEGGQNITATGTAYQDEQPLIDFHVGLNRHPGMGDRYEENFKNWRDAGGRLFVHFVEAEAPSRHGSFGALEYITQETSPKWDALTAFRDTPCWWDGC